MRLVTDIVIHCSATPNGDGRFKLENLDRMHRERGWTRIGYHKVIEVDGTVRDGRGLEEVGAHVAGNNARSVGVCVVGTDRFTGAQWEALADVIGALKARYPGALIFGHRDYSPDLNGDGIIDPWEFFKTCPGFDVRAWLLSGMDPLWNPRHVVEP